MNTALWAFTAGLWAIQVVRLTDDGVIRALASVSVVCSLIAIVCEVAA